MGMIFYPRYFPVAGFTPLPNLMFIRNDCRDNLALIKHEETHQTQQRADGVLTFWFRYLFSKKHRQAYEVEAYKCQIFHGASLKICAIFLSSMYYLDITFEEAEKLLTE
jgi:hypothetical protein